jgi:flagellar hook-associated protein 1 FlgK
MRASFFGLNLAMSGLYASQKALDITSHNISNANTTGYSRQIVSQTADNPIATGDGTGMVGNGVRVTGAQRVRDQYLDFKYWSENVSRGEWEVKNTVLSDIQATFNEPSNSGFNKVLDDFFSSIQELSKNPSSLATRASVKEKGVMVANYFNSMATSLEKIQSDNNYAVKSKVDEINSISQQICSLNEQIYKYETQGESANDLRDQRTVLVDNLSKLIKIDANEVVVGKLPNGEDDKRFQIVVDGKYLVDNFKRYAVTYKQSDTKNNPEDISGIYNLYWEDGTKFKPNGGELKGYLDVRDGAGDINNEFKGAPYYTRKLNKFVQVFAKAFNEGFIDYNGNGIIEAGEDKIGHADGYGLTSAAGDPLPGIRFFTMNSQSSAQFISGAADPANVNDINALYNNMTAKNISISQDIVNSVGNIFTSTVAGEVGNGQVVLSIIDFRHDSKVFSEGTPEDYMRSLISNLGIDAQQAQRLQKNQETIVNQIDNRRTSNSGVSIDEETANMIKYQHAYNAAAKLVTVMSQIYDTLINKTGSY